MTRIRLVALATVALLGLGACGSDSKTSGDNVLLSSSTLPDGDTTTPDITIPDITIPDISIPEGVVPGNLTEECTAIALQLSVVMAQMFAPTGEQADLSQVFGDISTKVPEELRADVQVMGEAFARYAEVLKSSNNDFSNPDVQEALAAIDSPEVQAANERLTAYFDATCPQN